MNKLTKTDVVYMLACAMNNVMGSPCNVSIELTSKQTYKIIFEEFPDFEKVGYLVFCLPQDAFKLKENNDIASRELNQNEIRVYFGKNADTTTPLIHTNIFQNDGHPCLGGGASTVRIKTIFDFAAYCVMTALRLNMTGQSFLSPTTRSYGQTTEEMKQFTEKVRKVLERNLGKNVMSLDYYQIYEEIAENFNDQLKTYKR